MAVKNTADDKNNKLRFIDLLLMPTLYRINSRFWRDFLFLYPNWLALPEPTFRDRLFLVMLIQNLKNILAMTAITKITAAKLLVLINLPFLLLIAGVYQIGSAVIV